MKEPPRLFASDPDLARIRAMLDRDGPPAGAHERAAKRLVGVPASSSPEPRADRLRPSFKLWIVMGVGVLAVLTAGIANVVRAPGAPPNAPAVLAEPANTPVSVESKPAVDEPSAALATAQPTFRVEDLPTASPKAVASTQPPSADPFLEELALVEQARGALAKGRGRECLEAVKAYEKRFAKMGLFREEVEVMRIEALAMSGDRAQARARGARFLESHRDTPYAERIRRVLDQSASER